MIEVPEGPFRATDLDELGVPDFTLRRWLKDGLVRRVITGVYCAAEVADTIELRAQSASLVLSREAVICDRSAAWLWGVDVLDPDERFAVPDLEVCVPPGHHPPERHGVSGVERDLLPGEISVIHGVRVTSPVRTALDLACSRGRWRALATLDAFMRVQGVTHGRYAEALTRYSGRRGVSQARELAPMATPLAESPGESWVRGAIHDDGLPAPLPQLELFENGILMARLDLSYRHWRIAVEYDGEEFHGPEQREHDESRRRWLRQQGWHVIVVRKHQFKGPALAQWLDELNRVIEERRARPKRRYARRPEPWVKNV